MYRTFEAHFPRSFAKRRDISYRPDRKRAPFDPPRVFHRGAKSHKAPAGVMRSTWLMIPSDSDFFYRSAPGPRSNLKSEFALTSARINVIKGDIERMSSGVFAGLTDNTRMRAYPILDPHWSSKRADGMEPVRWDYARLHPPGDGNHL